MRRLSCLLFALLALALALSSSVRAFDDTPLAIPAAQYLQSIRDGRDAGGQPAASLLQQADQQAPDDRHGLVGPGDQRAFARQQPGPVVFMKPGRHGEVNFRPGDENDGQQDESG